MKQKLLFIDDEKNVLQFFQELFENEYEVYVTNNGFKAVDIISKVTPDLVFLDIIMPEIDGIETLKMIKARFANQLVVMLTAVSDVNSAVKALKLGALDYICKPFEIKDIRDFIKKTLSYKILKNNYAEQTAAEDNSRIEIIGSSLEIRKSIELAKKIADKDVTVLLNGDTGAGKEVFAKYIHSLSGRSKNNFVSVDCSAIPSTLLESELFGYEKGAFTGAVVKKIGRFEMADRGSLFLDEIGNLPVEFQPKLLRAIQEGEIYRLGSEQPIKIDVRIIVATHINLEESVKNGFFREDLFFRLNVIKIELPPLRRRLEDIKELFDYFLRRFCGKFGTPLKKYDSSIIKLLQSYEWPGNIREFQNAVERAVVLSGDKIELTKDLFILKNQISTSKNDLFNSGLPLKEAQTIFEKEYIHNMLARCGGSRKEAAEKLDIDRSYISKLITKYDIKI
ncbi:MAG TPA: sigma-54 dependent transcriptional regulator [bacterium]|nr:sigma-54 dependent transcriptional regulator [bacterium]HPN31815.1 sigma-54 dependent transcriptional regulator [bacterium]